jgi:hypothetical protein
VSFSIQIIRNPLAYLAGLYTPLAGAGLFSGAYQDKQRRHSSIFTSAKWEVSDIGANGATVSISL